jgi:HEAT repeat protein
MINLQECIDRLGSGDEADRIYAAEDIGYAGQAAGVDPLLERLPQERSRAVREAIFAALLQIDDDAVIEGAIRLLDSRDSFLRNQAVQLLQVRGVRALPCLERAFDQGDRDRRKFVIDVLARLGNCDSFDLFSRALADPDPNVVITAVESLGNTRQTRFRGQILNLLSPALHPMLLSACIEALAQISDDSTLAAVRSRLGTDEVVPEWLRPSWLRLIGATGTPREVHEIASFAGAPALHAAVLNALTLLRNRHPDVVIPSCLSRPLQEMVSDNQPPLAYGAVRLLGSLSADEEVFDFLVKCLERDDKAIRIGAVQALREAGGARGEAILQQRLVSENDEEILQAWGGKRVE